jgi:hypothetical protein
MRSGYTAVAIGVCDGGEVCGMGRPMPAEVARGLGWRSGALGGRQISTAALETEQAQVRYGHERLFLAGVPVRRSVFLYRWTMPTRC